MNYILLSGIILFLALCSVFSKLHNQRSGKGGAFAYSAMTCFWAMCTFCVIGGRSLSFTPGILLYAIAFAAMFGMNSVCNILAIRSGSMSLTSLFTSYSLMVPTFFGILLWGESISTWFFAGVILLCISLFLIHFRKGDLQISLKWFIFVFLAFLGNGLCSTLQRIQQMAFNYAFSNEFMIAALAILTIFLAGAAVGSAPRESLHTLKKSWYLALGQGTITGLMNFLVMVLNKRMAASLMFPIISAGSIIAVFTISRIFFKERLSKMQIFGSVVGILSIICFNI